MFVKKQGKLHVIIFLYVDDMIVTGNDDREIVKLQAELFIRFEMKDLGELSHFLGFEVESVKMKFLFLKRAMWKRS